MDEVLKREVIEGDKLKAIQQKLKKAADRASKQSRDKTEGECITPAPEDKPAALHLLSADN